MRYSPCQYNRSGQKSGSSAAIKFGVKLLLSVTHKNSGFLQIVWTKTRRDFCRARLIFIMEAKIGSSLIWVSAGIFCNICYLITFISKRESRRQSGLWLKDETNKQSNLCERPCNGLFFFSMCRYCRIKLNFIEEYLISGGNSYFKALKTQERKIHVVNIEYSGESAPLRRLVRALLIPHLR